MRRRLLLTGAAALAISRVVPAEAAMIKVRRPLLTGRQQVVNAFSLFKSKIQSGQGVTIFVNADSTAYAQPFGPYVLFSTLLAQQLSGTFTYYLWGEWNNATGLPTGPKAYNAAVTVSYGSGPTITMYL